MGKLNTFKKIGLVRKWLLLKAGLLLISSALPGSLSGAETLHTRYIRTLEPWVKAASGQIRFLSGDTAVYGLAQHGHWYMQAHDTAFCALAVLGTDSETDESRAGQTKEDMRRTALAMLRYTLRSHLAGGRCCTDGQPWGHTWITPLGLERMSAGVDALEDYLDDELRNLYAAVYASEADWILEVKLTAGLTENNHPESNMWNGAALWRAAALNPENPNAAAWREKACCYFINSMATPSDETNERVIDGKTVAERFAGANMFDSRACNHHGYQNVGYMNITLSNLALIHFWCRRHGVEPPESLYFNALEQWKVVKACLFDDGRLLRVGGDTRIRYCYCQDYAIFAWLLARDRFGDADIAAYESGWLDQVQREQDDNLTGWLMRNRLAELWEKSPLYYLRLEGDKACTLATAAYWHREIDFDALPVEEVSAPNAWHDSFHGAWLVKGVNRTAAWSWIGAWKAGGLLLPADRSDMAEWQHNLAGRIDGAGLRNLAAPEKWTGFAFDSGFATCGRGKVISDGTLAEGDHSGQIGTLDLAYCALPDDCSAVAVQRALVDTDCYLREVRGLELMIPNDVFNGFKRTVITADGETVLTSRPEKEELSAGQKWLNIDGRLGVIAVYGGDLCLYHPAEPQILVQNDGMAKPLGGNLYCEEIVQAFSSGTFFQPAGTTLFDSAALLMAAGAEATRKTAESGRIQTLETADADLRLIKVPGADGIVYYLAVNFSGEEKTFAPEEAFGVSGLSPIGETGEKLAPRGIGLWK